MINMATCPSKINDNHILLLIQEIKNLRGIIDRQQEEIKTLKDDFSALRKVLNQRIGDIEINQNNNVANKQLIEVKQSIEKNVLSLINPKIDRLTHYVQFQLQDGDELVTEYRKRLYNVYNPNNKIPVSTDYLGCEAKRITYNEPKVALKAREQGIDDRYKFQRETFMFTDKD